MAGKRIARNVPMQGRPQLTVAEQGRLLKIRSSVFSLQNLFKYGYRNKEDPSNLPANTMVVGSQNVLTNAAELVGIRQGYALDGDAGNQNDYGIDSAYDFSVRNSFIRNTRKWSTNLEVRYVNPVSSAVSWVNIIATLTATKPVNFTSFWDQTTELKQLCAFVNGDNKVYVWSGGIGSFASATGLVTGTIATVTIDNAGSGYVAGDTLNVTGGGGTLGTVRVLTTSGSAIATLGVVNPGSGYTAGSGIATSGGTGSSASLTITVQSAGTLTVSGTQTTNQLNFLGAPADVANFKLLIDGITYTYIGVSGETFLGVTPDPNAAGITVGDAVIQKPYNFLGANMTGLSSAVFNFDLISTLENQVWYGDKTRNDVYVTKTNSLVDVSSSSVRLPAQGALITLDAPPISFMPSDGEMYMGAGINQWWLSQKKQQTIEVGGIAVSTETLYARRLETTFNQGPQSQAMTSKYKNSIIFVSNEPIVNSLGLVKDVFASPQFVNISDPIKFDMDAYDFTNAAIDYDNYYIYFAVPAEEIIRMYNVQKNYWEAPQTIPVSRFYHVQTGSTSTLYGHSGLTNESYQLFTGYNDNGNPINSVAAFPYVATQGGSADMKKNFNRIYTEGYIASNTTLMMTVNYDFGGYSGTYTTIIEGSDLNIIFNRITDGSLGQNTLGSQPIGSILNIPNAPAIPKFRQVSTMPRVDFFDYQIVFSSNDVDQNWTLLRFGPAIGGSQSMPVSITK